MATPSPIRMATQKRWRFHISSAYRIGWRTALTLPGIGERPVERAPDRPPPAGLQRIRLIAADPRLELAVQPPEPFQLGVAAPGPAAQPGQESRAQGRGLGLARAPDRDSEQVGLELAEKVHDRGAAVDLELAQRVAGIGRHGIG